MPKTYWPDNTIYFLTGSTFLHFPYFKEDKQKQIILNQIKKIKDKVDINISAFSIAINHYRLLFFLKQGLDLIKVKQFMHGGTAFEYKKIFKMKYSEMWQSSKTLQVCSEDDYWKVMGYIIGNLLKHKEAGTFEELKVNPFSSFSFIFQKYGEEFARELVYNVIDIPEDAEGAIDFSEFKNIPKMRPSAVSPGRKV